MTSRHEDVLSRPYMLLPRQLFPSGPTFNGHSCPHPVADVEAWARRMTKNATSPMYLSCQQRFQSLRDVINDAERSSARMTGRPGDAYIATVLEAGQPYNDNSDYPFSLLLR